jgi:hypothetical protein
MIEMSTVWDRTTGFVSAAIGSIMPIAVLFLFLPVSIQLATTPLLTKQDAALRFIVIVAFWAFELVGTLSIMVLALGATLRPGDAVRAALPRLGPTIATFMLLLAIGVLLMLPIGFALAASGIDMTSLNGNVKIDPGTVPAGTAIGLLVYMLVLFVAFIWITTRLLVIEPVILAERRGIRAITRAFELTRGLTWRLIGVFILYGIVSTVAVLAAQTVFGSIFKLIAPDDGDIGLASVLTSVVVAAVSCGFKVLAAVFVAKLYGAIGERREQAAEFA